MKFVGHFFRPMNLARHLLQYSVIAEFHDMLHADLLQIGANRFAFVARRDDYLAVFLALRVTQHLPERAFLDGLLLWLVQYQQTGMVAGRSRPDFQKPEADMPSAAG